MSIESHTFRDRLLASQPVTPALKEHYEKEVQAMFSKPLTGVHRWAWLFSAILGVGLAVVFGPAAVFAPPEFPAYARVGFVAGTFFCLAWAILALRIFVRGAIDLKIESPIYYGMAWAFPLFLLIVFMMFAPNDLVGLRMIVCGIAYLVMGAAFLLRGVIERSELKTQEKLLEIEYRLAEMEELLKARQ